MAFSGVISSISERQGDMRTERMLMAVASPPGGQIVIKWHLKHRGGGFFFFFIKLWATKFNAQVKVCTRDYDLLFTSLQSGSAPTGVLDKLL